MGGDAMWIALFAIVLSASFGCGVAAVLLQGSSGSRAYRRKRVRAS
jgi:hypothetical protein